MTSPTDATRRFLFEGSDVRGEIAHLEQSFAEVMAIHQYAPAVGNLLGEFMTAAVLLSTTIKFDGRLVLQAQSQGQIPLMMAECTSDLEVRAIARGAEEATGTHFEQLFGEGQLAITIEPRNGQRYQGIVPLSGNGLADCIEHYFSNSEQLPTRLWLGSRDGIAHGLLLQQLPAQIQTNAVRREQDWQHLCTLAETLTQEELHELAPEQLLHRLYHLDPLKVFEARNVKFACSCSRQRCYDALASMGAGTVGEIIEEDGQISMDCEFCNQQYLFTANDLADILGTQESSALH